MDSEDTPYGATEVLPVANIGSREILEDLFEGVPERERPLVHRDFSQRAFTVGVGGPVGSGKTALMLARPSIDPDPELPRGDFLDWAVEGGVRFRREHRIFEAFAAYERRNDVFLLVPGARTRGLFGIRFRFAEEE